MEKSKILIMLDPGHGSNTTGKKSKKLDDNVTLLYEYAYVRDITYAVYNKLISQGYRCYITHPEIDEVGTTSNDLKLRATRANIMYDTEKAKGNKAIFVSIHVNANGNGEWQNAKGWSVWTSKGLTKGDILATYIYNAAKEILQGTGKNIRQDMSDGDPDYESDFYVLKYTNCPACLTENMFMDNKEDVKWLLSDIGRNTIVDIHVNGIKSYIQSL